MDSRIPGFFKLPISQRRETLASRAHLDEGQLGVFDQGGIDVNDADRMVENAIGVYALPLGVGLNFRVNNRDYAVPMAVEEPSVIAAASNAAKMIRAGGGFHVDADPPVMTAQIEILDVEDPHAGKARLDKAHDELIALADSFIPRMVKRGGGTRLVEIRVPSDHRVVVHLHIDCRDAMGANLVNTVAEGVAPRAAQLAGGRPGLRILTNLNDRRMVTVTARAPFAALATPTLDGGMVAREIASASQFAEQDPYRAVTHNKGIMNGIDAAVIASGNDWRGVEAGAHAYAASTGQYRPLCAWRIEEAAAGAPTQEGHLLGHMRIPMAVGTVGGTLGVHAGARTTHEILGVKSATELAGVIACVGVASNLAALRALATDGIQKGHMACHRRAVEIPMPVQTTLVTNPSPLVERDKTTSEADL